MPQPIEDTELLKDLKSVGISEYEAKVYLALLINGPMTGNEIHRASGVPHGKTYSALEKLEAKGFINVIAERPKVFKPVDPSIVVKDALENKLKKAQELFKNLPEKLESIKRTRLKEEPISEKIQFISEESPAMFNKIYRTAKKRLRRIHTYEERHYERARITDKLVKKGVRVQFLVTKITEQGLKWMKEDLKIGIEVKYYPVENLRVNLKDDSEVIITILNPKNPKDRIYLYAQSEGLAKAMGFYFDYLWEKAKEITKV